MSETDRLLFRIVIGGCLVQDSEDGTSCHFCGMYAKYQFCASVEVHASDCAYVAARDYLVAKGYVDAGGEPLVDLDGNPIASRVEDDEE